MSIKLIALDIDGTLINDEGIVPEANCLAIHQARERGIKAVLVTGRSFHSAVLLAQEIDVDMPIICANGALIKDSQGVEWWGRRLDWDIARQIAAWADARRYPLITMAGECNYYTWPESWREDSPSRPYDRVVDHNMAALTAPPLCILAAGEKASHSILEQFAPQSPRRVRFDRHEIDGRLRFVTALHPTVSKEGALALLCTRWGLSADQVLALGDNFSDLGMLRWAQIGVAMGNASPAIHMQVKWVAPSNDEAGVAWAIQRFILNGATHP